MPDDSSSTSESTVTRETSARAGRQLAQDRELPEGAPAWLPVLSLWPEVTEASHAALVACFGETRARWPEFEGWLRSTGLATPVPDSDPASLVVGPEWLPTLARALDGLLDDAEARAMLVRCSHPELRPPILTAVAEWARTAGRWDVLQDLWRQVADNAANIPDGVLLVYADLPSDARRDYPILTWASAVAEADAATPASRRTAVFLNRMILDSALLHANWALREDTDTAVFAGILRMIGERHLPPSARPLEAAWRTKQDLDKFIDERSREGRPPTRLSHSLFRVTSGQLAVYRAELGDAVAEARWGGILALGPSTSDLAVGIEALAQSLAGEVRSPDAIGPPAPSPENFRFGCLSQMSAVMTTLARGRESLQSLDRAGVESALRAVSQDTAAIAGVWASWVGLEALHAAIWGDAPQGLNRLFAALADQPMGVREQDEPMGDLMLGRARAILLSRIGAFGAATLSTDLIAERFRTVPLARTLLWAGQLGPAVRTMELTLPDPKLLHSDRLQLLIIRGAATMLDGSISDDIRSDTITALRHLLVDRSYLPLAMLPRRARDAVLDLARSLASDPETSGRFAELLDRLPDTSEGGGEVGLLRLTEREEVLLPLLAGSESIPDIARRLHVSVHTVRTQVATLREKFQASTRAELVRKAGSYGALN
ncbi:MAG TPA: LuxR C-terminal-related transcriptional regulator [Propionicimonas sp.]|uniref:helix-turn-helix transcriptional regulator n=1 Tax=Propionicimonas sp. TaxID=1955623 RepID=UPI002F426226